MQTRLAVSHPNDVYEQEADQVANEVMRMPAPTIGVARTPAAHVQRLCAGCEEAPKRQPLEEEELPQTRSDPAATTPVSASVENAIRALSGRGQPLPDPVRSFMESRFNADFSAVRVHADPQAHDLARSVNAEAFTVGSNVVFGAGHYAPETDSGKHLLAHELTHVVQQTDRPAALLQRFTAERGAGNRILIKPEAGDTDADLDRILCPSISERKIAGRSSIDVTACFPPGTVKAMTAGPYNCSDFVHRALGETPAGGTPDLDSLLTPLLWEKLLKKGFRVRSFGVVKEDGTVVPVQDLSWKQLNPRMGDLVFMIGEILVRKGATEPDPAGDTFTATWDHVGFFIVRSQAGLDYHLAKDGEENPVGIYHTGTEPDDWTTPGAYVKGIESLAAYLGEFYYPTAMSEAYRNLTDSERAQVNDETDRRFREQTGVTRKLDWDDPQDVPLVRTWLGIRDEVMAAR